MTWFWGPGVEFPIIRLVIIRIDLPRDLHMMYFLPHGIHHHSISFLRNKHGNCLKPWPYAAAAVSGREKYHGRFSI